MGAAMLGQLRPVMVGGDQDEGEGLVVAEQNVVARPQSLDQIGLQQQRLDLGMGRHHFDRPRIGDHSQGPRVQAGRLGVILHPIPQVLGLADVQDLAGVIQHAVDAGSGRHRRQCPGDRLTAPFDRRPAVRRGLGGRRQIVAGGQVGGRRGRLVGFCHGVIFRASGPGSTPTLAIVGPPAPAPRHYPRLVWITLWGRHPWRH
jgi:hypothetical protein